MKRKRALITGVTGQDGSYLAELLLSYGYEVYGLVRRSATPHLQNIEHIRDQVHLIQGDLLDSSSLNAAIQESQPHEVYNLAAMSHVGTSFHQPYVTSQINGIGFLRLMEAIALSPWSPRVYQASTSEMFGNSSMVPQNEETPMHPVSPYGIAKHFAHQVVSLYRQSYGMFVCSGILFNHESERRGLDFVTRKICHGLVRIKYGLQERLELGNLVASRDWGYAPDYVRAMWLMLQQDKPGDYVIATGQTHTISEFLREAANVLEMEITPGMIAYRGEYGRPTDIRTLCGDAERAREALHWEPLVSFREMVARMTLAEEQIFLTGEMTTCHSKKEAVERR